jgi:ComF family protein
MILWDMKRLGHRVKGGFRDALHGLRDSVDALLFPWCCPLCEREGELRGPFCKGCRDELLATSATAAAKACPRCAMPVGPHADLRGGCSECRGQPLGFDAAVAFAPYEGAVRELCLHLKQERNAWLAPWLGRLLVEARRDAFTRLNLPTDTWLTPVPLHRWRQWRRGYNQAEALAQGIGRGLGFSVRNALRRKVATDRLADSSKTERMHAMRGAFDARWRPGLRGRTVLLVDDVLTSGATSGAAARALTKAGAKRVVVVVVGRTL